MKYRVVGWTDYDDCSVKSEDASCAARSAIVDEIRENGWEFSGWDHQEISGCVPVLNDGKKRTFSRRGWGGVMAEAHGYYGSFDYSLFAEGSYRAAGRGKFPGEENGFSRAFSPETDLNEEITVEVSPECFREAESGDVTLPELGRVRYADSGDALVLTCGDRSARYKVIQAYKRRRLLPEGVQETIDKPRDREQVKAAEKIAAATPVTVWIKIGRWE